MGTEVAKGLGAKVILIVGPQGTLFKSWGRTAIRQGLADGVKLLVGTAPGKRAQADLQWGIPGVYVTTPQWFARQREGYWEKQTQIDMVIFDEVHQAGRYGIATSKRLLELSHIKWRLGLSGTPLRNSFENAWAIVRWIEPARMPLDFWVWRLRDCETEYDRFAPQTRRVVGERIPGSLFASLTCFIIHYQRSRCCKYHPEGFLAGLPEPLVIEKIIPMHPDQAKFYHEMERKLASELEAPDASGKVPVVVELPIEMRAMLRASSLGLPYPVHETIMVKDEYGNDVEKEVIRLHFHDDAVSPKLDDLITDIPTYEGDQTLVLTHSKRFAKVAVDRLNKAGYATEGWHGDVTMKKRGELFDRFISGETKAIVGVISAMGTGTDGLQEVCHNASWLSIDDDPTNNEQGVSRLDRLGQNKQVVNRYYLSDKTIDVGMLPDQITKRLALNASLRKGDS